MSLTYALWFSLCIALASANLPKHVEVVCSSNNTGVHPWSENVEGMWYEVGKMPLSTHARCLTVEVLPRTESKFDIIVRYTEVIGANVKQITESKSFSMDFYFLHGFFRLDFYIPGMEASIIYLLTYVDGSKYAFVCGFSTVSSTTFFKVFARSPERDEFIIRYINQQISGVSFYKDNFVWMYDLDCNRGVHGAGVGSVVILFFGSLYFWLVISKFCPL